MNDPVQLVILKRLTAQIETVTTLNGYDFDLFDKVFRGRTLFGDETQVPFVSILEPPRQPNDLPVGDAHLSRLVEWSLLVQGWATDDKENPLDPAYALKASVEQRLSRLADLTNGKPTYPLEYRLGRTVTDIRIGPGICRPPNDASPFAFFYLPVVVTYREDLASPFLP